MFALMTYQLSSLAGGRILAVLEGGYNLTSISNSALAVCEVLQNRAMLRRIYEEKEHFATEKKKISSWSIKAIRDVCAAQQKHWSILRGFQVTPSNFGIEDLETLEDSSSSSSDSDTEMADNQPTSSAANPGHTNILELINSGAAHAVVPLDTCPHLEQVQALPAHGINASSLCQQCEIGAEVWACLTCYQYNCGRFVHKHALHHHLSSSHPMALSMADLSVWCYPCESYVHNAVLIDAKSAAHESKFGERLPN
uniref:UBP-type domain-containing protein n=1 Tax=Caenorhabditis japonica TaxID=281687 RepID=A0A8R1DG43_CAEJA